MDNFKDTLYRMYYDAVLLNENKRCFNSCYLAGYVIECYAKLVVGKALNDGYTLSKNNVRSYSHNIGDMSSDITNYLISQNVMSNYCIDLSNECSSILGTWNPNSRYSETTHEWNTESKSNSFIEEVKKVMKIVTIMQVDGVI